MNHTDDNTGGLIMAASRRGGWLLLVLLLLTGLILTAIATRFTKSDEDAADAREFDFACKEIEGKILDRLNAHEQILRSGAAFYEQAGNVSRHKWHQFTARQKVEQQLPGIQGIGFALLIPHQKLSQHIKDIRAEGFPEYRVRPEGERDVYSSIIYLEPFTNRNLRAFGYDMLSEPVRRAAMERARDHDAATLSGKVFLVQETDKDVQAGTLMYVPVYHTDMPCETVAQRRAALIGWVYSPYRMNDLMRGILGRWDIANDQRIRLEIFDGKAAADALLYDSQPADSRKTAAASQFTLQHQILSSGHQWTLRFTKTGSHTSFMEYSKVWLVLFGGTLTTLLLSGLFFNLYNTRFKARQLAGRLTADLQHVTTRLELAAGAGGVGIWDYEVPNNRLIWDDQMFRLYGITPTQFSGAYEAWTAGVHPEDRGRGDKEIKMAISGEKEFDTEFRVLWPDGSTHHIRAMACVQRNAGGKAERVIGTNWDITGLKQAEDALSRQTALLSNLLDSIPDIVFFKDLEGVYLGCNPLFAEFAGKIREEIIGHTDYDLFRQDVADAFRVYDSIVIAEKKARHNEEWIDYPDGRRLLIDTLKAPLTTQDGRVIGMLGISRDITDKKHAEEMLAKSKWRLEGIIAATKLGTWEWNVQTGEMVINEEWTQIIGYTPEELAPVSIKTRERFVHPDDLKKSEMLMERYLAGELPYYDCECRMKHKNGHWVWINDRGKVFEKDQTGRPLLVIGSHRDITERKQSEAAEAYNREFEHLVTTLANQFINVPSGNIDSIVNDALKIIGEFVHADRSYIFQFYDNRRLMDNTHEWCAEGIEPQIDMLKKLPTEVFLWLMKQICNNEIIIVPKVSELPDDAKVERDILQEQDIQSLILIPLVSGTVPFGYIGFDAVKAELEWPKETASLLKIAGGIIANALRRKLSEQLIQSELDLALKLSASHSFTETLQSCLQTALDISGMDCGGIYLIDETDNSLSLVYHHGLPENFVMAASHYQPGSKQYELIMKGDAVYTSFPDMNTNPSKSIVNEGLKAIAILPVVCKGRIVASLNVASHALEQVPEFTRKTLETVASHIGSAIIQSKHEEQINTANKNFKSLFNTIDDLLFIVGTDGKILHTNTAAQNLLEYDEEEFKQFHVLNVHPPDQQQEAKINIENMIAGNDNACMVPLISKSGKKIPVETIITHGEWDGKPVLFGISRDITERIRSEAALNESENRFRALTEMLPTPVFEADTEGRIVYCNHKGLEITGYSAEEITGGFSVCRLLIPEDAPQWQSTLKTVLNGSSDSREYTGQRKDGQRFPGLLYCSPVIKENAVTGVRGVVIDLTELKKAEAAFRESALQKSVSENLKSIIDNIPGTVYRISQDDTIKFLSLSSSAEIMSRPKTISSNLFTSMPVIHPDDRQMVSASNKEMQQNKHSQVLVYRIIAEDNSVKWIEDRRTSIFNSDGRYMGIDGIMLDITARVKAEEERKALENSIRNKQRLETIGTLAGGIAHDFNNILVPILGYAELSVSTLPPEDPLYEYSTEIMKAAERAKNLVSQILTFSRPVESNLTPVPVQSLLKEALKLLRPSIPATINIKPLIDDSCRNVLADSSQIHQIIVNLCTNAFYAMKDTDGTLTIELHEVHDKSMYHVLCNSDAEYLMLSVIDTGTGMDESTMERIYEPFFTTKPVNEGTGLGLSVVHGIVKSCKGEITAESNKGKGSTFRVFLPVIEDAAEEIKISGNPVKGKGRVLFVDDEPAAVKFIFTMLSKLGYTTETTNSPTEALELFNRNPVHFDLIITDLTMPDMSGIELAKAIHEKNSGLPIILMTGHGKDLDYAIPPEDCGIRRILKKPVKINILASAIDEIIYLQEKEV